MPDLAKMQDDLGTVHYSSLWVEGDEKLLFLPDIDGKGAQHIEGLVESAGPVFDAIFEHVLDPPAAPVAGNSEDVVRWLSDHVRPPLSMYFAYEVASVQDIKACACEAGYTGSTLQSLLLTYMTLKSSLQDVASKIDVGDITERGDAASDSIGTLHFRHYVPFGETNLGFGHPSPVGRSQVTIRQVERDQSHHQRGGCRCLLRDPDGHEPGGVCSLGDADSAGDGHESGGGHEVVDKDRLGKLDPNADRRDRSEEGPT